MHYYPSRRTFLRTSSCRDLLSLAAARVISPRRFPQQRHRPPQPQQSTARPHSSASTSTPPIRPIKSPTIPTSTRLSPTTRLGACHTSIGWRYAEPAKGKFSWDQTDDGLARLPKDVDILMLLLSTPDWSSGVDPRKPSAGSTPTCPKTCTTGATSSTRPSPATAAGSSIGKCGTKENGIDFFHPQPDAKVLVELLKTNHDAPTRPIPIAKSSSAACK